MPTFTCHGQDLVPLRVGRGQLPHPLRSGAGANQRWVLHRKKSPNNRFLSVCLTKPTPNWLVVGLPCLCHIATICVYHATLLQSTIPCAQNVHSLTAIHCYIPTEVITWLEFGITNHKIPQLTCWIQVAGPGLEGPPVVLHHLHGFPAPRGKTGRKVGKDKGKDWFGSFENMVLRWFSPWESSMASLDIFCEWISHDISLWKGKMVHKWWIFHPGLPWKWVFCGLVGMPAWLCFLKEFDFIRSSTVFVFSQVQS